MLKLFSSDVQTEMSAISRVVRWAACNAYPDEDKRCISNMHRPTLFLLPLLTGIVASPAHNPSWRTKRDENTRIDATTLVEQKQDTADLPPLPLEYEEEDDIYMPLDDPRVGTVDADGNVLVPVDDDGNILPGYEHLVRPVRIQMDVEGVSKQNVGQNSSVAAETLQPAVQVEKTEKSSDFDDTTYDETEANDDVSTLPAANDYVDSREAGDSKVIGEGAKVESSFAREGSEAADENDIRPDVEAMEAEKKIEETIDGILSPSKDELEEETMEFGQGAASDDAAEEAVGETNDEGSQEEKKQRADLRSPFDALVSEPVDDEEDLAHQDEEVSPKDIDKAVDELIKVLPVDNNEEEELENENPLGNIREGGVFGSDTYKAKPDSAPLNVATSALLIAFVLSLWIA